MSNPAFWRRLLRLPGRDARGVVDDELRFHLAMRSEELLARGMTPDEARLTAEKEFGELRAIRDACVTIEQRRTRNLLLREVTMDFFHDLRFGVRSLRNSPGFAMAAILCVGLGIGVTTTIFSAVHATLIRPLPFERPDELVVVYSSIPQKNWHGINISYADYLSWKERNRSLSQLGMWTWTSVTLTGGMDAERVDGARVTPNLFPLLGVRPILGRGFRAEEDREGDDRVILLSHALWRRRYAGDSTIVGRTIPVNGLQFTVVGVMPEHFAFPDQGQVWVPLAGDPQENRGNRYFAGAIGRLAPGVTLGRAQRDMAAVASALEREFPEENALWTTDVTPLRDDLVGDLERPLLVFSGAVFFVLLIACSNVANLLLARSASRQREIAVRTALGAGRGRLVRQLLTESVLIAALGGALGVGASAYGVRLLRHSFPAEVPYYLPIGLNLPTLAFAALVTMATGVLFGILPAMRAAGEDASSWLRDGTRGTGGAARSRVRNALIVAEVALSLVLMTGAGLLIKSYRSLESTDLGFQETGVLSVRVYLPVEKYREGARRVAFFTQLLDRLRALPGVAAVGSAEGIPLSGWDVQGSVMGEGWPPPRPGEDFESLFQYVSPDYLTAIGVSIVRGRGLTYADHDSARVAVINESFAKRAFPNENPLGKRIRPGGPPVGPVHWTTIVGVARDFRHYRLPQKMGPALYYPFFASPPVAQQVVIRLRDPGDDPLKLAPTVRRLVSELDADVPISDVKTFEQAVSRSLWRQRLQGQVLGVFASLALLLAAVGIYGVISYTVAQRTREFGVRVALGAEQRDVMGLVLRQTARLAGAGVLIGLVVALALTRFLTTLLYEVKPTDTGTLALVVTVLVSITLLASWMPARRAMRVDPLVAMRPE